MSEGPLTRFRQPTARAHKRTYHNGWLVHYQPFQPAMHSVFDLLQTLPCRYDVVHCLPPPPPPLPRPHIQAHTSTSYFGDTYSLWCSFVSLCSSSR